MLLAEEFVLLTLDAESGKKALSGEKYGPALGAALLVELALSERVSVAPPTTGRRGQYRVSVTSTAPTDDDELDAMLQVILAKEGVKVGALITDLTWRPATQGLHMRLLARLVQAGVLTERRSERLGLRRWPRVDSLPEEEIRRRLQRCLLGNEEPTERTAALIALLLATGSLLSIVSSEDSAKKAITTRAKALSEGDWAGDAVKAAIAEARASQIG